ncbi:MAG: T9SS type A sorting domain-containing protein [Chitinophagaceae bacterium]|nr:T9SS type A sorting domain-containing protein [Chitinophagaceae bacterium]
MKKLIALLLFLSAGGSLFAQEGIQAGSAKRAPIEGKFLGFFKPETHDVDLLPHYSIKVSKNESEDQEALEEIKKEKMKLKEEYLKNNPIPEKVLEKTRGIDPTVVMGFNALNNQGTPSDNSVAVNKNGQIIAMVNSSLRVYSTSGGNIGAVSYTDNFFNTTFQNGGSLLTANTCDPKVIFDPQSERFIVFAQTCDGSSTTSQILIAFSKTSDATSGWYFYTFTGNPSSTIGQSVWFDYPKIGVSNHDLFVTGNLFNNNFDYVTSVVYQIDKTKCFAGNTLNTADAVLWYNIANTPFTIVPITNGHSGGYGNNMYLVSVDQGWSGTNLSVYEITNAVQSNPQLNAEYVSIGSTSPPANAVQKGSTVDLNTGDSRGQDGFYLNGTIHYVFHCDGGSGYTAVNYSRLKKVSGNWQVSNNQLIKIPGVDLAYPSIASMGWNNNDQSAIIAVDYASANDFPGIKAFFVNENFTVSNPIEVKTGTGYASVFPQGGETRWGDYTGMTREQNATIPTAWCFGAFGNTSHTWTNYIAKITTNAWATGMDQTEPIQQEVTIYPNPVEDFYTVDLNLKASGQLKISLLDVQGRLIKDIYKTYTEQGEHQFSFNKGALTAGTYILSILLDEQSIKNEKIIIKP